MKNGEEIREEVEKTLNAFDNITNLDGNPFLFTRLQAEIEKSGVKTKGELRSRILRPAILFIIVLFNIFTGIYFFESGNGTTSVTKQQYFSKISSEYSLSHSYYSGLNQTTGN